jgi:hypothetical protein
MDFNVKRDLFYQRLDTAEVMSQLSAVKLHKLGYRIANMFFTEILHVKANG